MQSQRLAKRHIVLLGIGHTNAHVLRMWRMNPIADTELICLSNYAVATYSGMLPAVLAGQVPESDMQIDLVRLCESSGARLLFDPVTGIDPEKRLVEFSSRPPVPFDALSIGIGSVPASEGIAADETLLAIKPMQTFLKRLEAAVRSVAEDTVTENAKQPLRIAVIGGGVAGVEVVLCLPGFLETLGRPYELVLITSGDRVPGGVPAGMQRRVGKGLRGRSVELVAGRRVVEVKSRSITLDDGTKRPVDLALLATGARPPKLLGDLRLPHDERGFLLTDHSLRSVSGDPIFAVGDSGSVQHDPLAKSGVYAVRQGPVLWRNLQQLFGGHPLESFRPQRQFMKLINLGTDEAVGEWRGMVFKGKWALRLKHRIDLAFMEKHRAEPMAGDGEPMICHGCGSKLGAKPLREALEGSQVVAADAAPIGDDQSGWIASTDFFSAPFRDPYLVGRITALHAGSDVIAGGARVHQVLANVVVPEGDPASQRQHLRDFLAGVRIECDRAGASLVGGHTTVGPRFEVGLTVIGKAIREGHRADKGQLRVDDALYLTRPLGSGTLLAAHMRYLCDGDAFREMVSTMLTPQEGFAELIAELPIRAATDVTGFGLAGHLIEMLTASRVNAQVDLDRVPLLAGAVALAKQGIRSSLAPDNYDAESQIDVEACVQADERYGLLFDPQTCGGLLLGVPRQQSDVFEAAVREREMYAVRIGSIVAESRQPTLRVLCGE